MRIDLTYGGRGENPLTAVTITLDDDDRAVLPPALLKAVNDLGPMAAPAILSGLALMWELIEQRKREFAASLREATTGLAERRIADRAEAEAEDARYELAMEEHGGEF